MIDLDAQLQSIEVKLRGRLRYYQSDLHGLSHLRQVAILAGRIAAESGVDVKTAMVMGFLHDCARMNDDAGDQHAHDSAQMARPLLADLFPEIDAEKVCRAIAAHADGMTTDDPLTGALWDADRLTLGRVGKAVREDLLSTPAARRMLRERAI